MKCGIVVFPGSNCDHDCYHILKHILQLDVHWIWHKDEALNSFDFIVLPGGFSYGDYLRPGAIARFSPIMKSVIDYANQGVAACWVSATASRYWWNPVCSPVC